LSDLLNSLSSLNIQPGLSAKQQGQAVSQAFAGVFNKALLKHEEDARKVSSQEEIEEAFYRLKKMLIELGQGLLDSDSENSIYESLQYAQERLTQLFAVNEDLAVMLKDLIQDEINELNLKGFHFDPLQLP